MKPSSQPSPAFLRKRKTLLVLPFLILPPLFFLFIILGGGKAARDNSPRTMFAGMGLNLELPKPHIDPKAATMNKMGLYEKADADSIKRREAMQRDPYHSQTAHSSDSLHGGNLSGSDKIMNHLSAVKLNLPVEDPKAKELLKKLDQLQQSIQQRTVPLPERVQARRRDQVPYTDLPESGQSFASLRLQQIQQVMRAAASPQSDPQLDRLDSMLDKISRIQQPAQKVADPDRAAEGRDSLGKTSGSAGIPWVTIPAVVQEDQTLYSGATIALRIPEPATIDRIVIPAGQLVYGQVSINGDRMLIHINSIRNGNSIYSAALQVYDLDGLPGIHIPDQLSREVAKQSADEGVNSMNIASFDPSAGAQAINATIQATKSLLSRKVKLVRVSVRAGYQVLLRNSKADTKLSGSPGTSAVSAVTVQDSCEMPSGDLRPFMHHSTRNDKMKLVLQGIYIQHNLLWLSLCVKNHSPIDYAPQYTRWYTRDRKIFKRTAVQEVLVPPVFSQVPPTVPGDAVQTLLVGFRPFTLSKDKELVLQIGESNGGRLLTLTIDHKELLKARKI